MRFLRTFLLYFVVITALVILFSPKRQLYYLGETALEPYGVVLSGEFVEDKGYALSLEGGALYYQDLRIAQLGDVSILPLLFFNAVNIAPFTFSDDMQRFIPGTIDELKLYHSIIDPTRVHLSGSGEFGKVSGTADLLNGNISIVLEPSAILLDTNALWLKEFKKAPTGEYLYEVAY